MPKIQMRRDTAANWKSVNPTLLAGEWALETDTKKMKIGNGTTNYNSLEYFKKEDNEWENPSEWIDIRSGAISNSVYFLVAHSSDYTQYAKFSMKASVSTAANTYDVFVDGIKIASTASDTATTLDWQTLALTSGFDVTYPAALRTHIVRITPTVSTDTLTVLKNVAVSGQSEQGMLWIHFTANNEMNLQNLTGAGSNCVNNLLEAVTSQSGSLKFVAGGGGWLLRYSPNLKTIPVLDYSGNSAYFNYIAANQTKLKNVVIKNASAVENADGAFSSSSSIEHIEFDNVNTGSNANFSYMLNRCSSLKKIPTMDYTSATNMAGFIANAVPLENTYLDLSQASGLKIIGFYGDSSHFVSGLKGIVVSSSAPFDGNSPQINVSYTGLDRAALVALFNSLPTVTNSQVCNVTGCTGAADLTESDLAIATGKGWTVTR